MKTKLTQHLRRLLAVLALGLVTAAHAQSIYDYTDPSGPASPPKKCKTDTTDTGGANLFKTSTGNVSREIMDLQLFAGTGEERLNFSRLTTSRYLGAIPTPLGSGGSWRHNYYWHAFAYQGTGGSEIIEVNYPDGTWHTFWRKNPTDLFLTAGPSIEQRIDHTDGDNYYTLTYPDGRRVVFSKPVGTSNVVLTIEGTYDRFNNYTTYLTDAKKRVIKIIEPAGRWIQINYGSVGNFGGATVTFSYTDYGATGGPASTVSVAGDFNGWNATANPMTQSGNVWSTTIPLQLGAWQYQFVIDGSIAIPDSANPNIMQIGSDFHSILNVTDADNGTDPGSPTPVPFTYTNATASTVYLTGTFNGWSATATPMVKSGSTWSKTVSILGGSHQYKLIVDGTPIPDPSNPFTAPDGAGGYNSKLAVGPLDEAVTSVVASDGRTVTYNYAMSTGPISTVGGLLYSTLTQVNYPDGTHAAYTYIQPNFTGRPLLKTVDDPRYDGAAKRIQYTYQPGNIEGFIYEESSLLTGIMLARLQGTSSSSTRTLINGNGGTHTINLNTRQMTSRTNSLGQTWTLGYAVPGSESFLQSLTDPLGHTTSFERTAEFGVIKKIINPDTTFRTTSYPDQSHPFYPASTTDENGKTTTFTRDASHRITRIDYPDAAYETYTYNAFGQVLTHRLRSGGTETMTYTATGLLTSKLDAAGKTWGYAYDSLDRLATVTDPRSNATSYLYNDRWQITRTTYPGGAHRDFTYDDYGNRLTVTNELGKTWGYAYDELSRVFAMYDPLNRITQYSYSSGVSGGCCGTGTVDPYPTGIITPSGKQVEIVYDTEWRKTSETAGANSADAATTAYTYDNAGNLLTLTDPLGKVWTCTYDTRDRRLTASDPLTDTTTWTYDGVGNVLTVTRPDNSVTVKTYDSMNRVLTARDPALQTTTFTYTPAGDVLTLKDAKLNVTTFTYDNLRRKTVETYPGGPHENWSYDNAGNVATYTTRNNQVKTSTYDPRNRETGFTWSSNSAPAVTKTYDDASRLLTLNNANSALTYAYDFAGQLTGETQNVTGLGAKTVAYSYDGDGNRATLTYPGGKVAAYSYTGRNQVDTITYDGPPPLVNYDYDPAGNRTVKTLENSTRAVSTYDEASRLTALDEQRSSGGVWASLQSFAYTLNSVGNRTDRYETNAGLTKRDKYTYLADDQLDIVKYNYTGTTQDRTVDYNYDAAGNRTTVSDSAGQSIATYTTNSLNQYASMGGQTENYDSNGNIGYGNGTGNVIYNHDAQNHVVSTSGGNSYTLAYDARNRCVKRVAGNLTTYLLWDGWSLIAEWTTGYTPYSSTPYIPPTYIPLAEARRYVHGARVDEILLAIAPTAAQTVHHVHDALGNVTALTDASGSVVERYTYDVFGQTTIRNASGTVLTASAYGNRFMFTGREWIAELNVYDYRNRMYAPGMGRFLETDPINYAAGDVNIYRYVSNKPNSYRDPFGVKKCCETEARDTRSSTGHAFWTGLSGVAAVGAGIATSEFGVGIAVAAGGAAILADSGISWDDADRHHQDYMDCVKKMKEKQKKDPTCCPEGIASNPGNPRGFMPWNYNP